MAYEIPTLPALILRTEADFERNAPDALRRADAKVAARALSGTAYELYGYQDWIARQSNPATCDEAMLLRWADWRLEGGRTPAVEAKGLATVTGSSGRLVDAGQVYRADDGRRYVVAQAVTLVDGSATLQVVAEDVGSQGNLEAGNLTAVTPVVGVNPTAIIGPDGIVGGTEQEDLEALRARVQAAFKNPSKVGNGADFVEWALEVPGVTRAWPLPRWMGPGTFGLAFVRDGDPDLIPTPAQVAEVQAYLDQKRPVTSEVYALAPEPRPIDFSLHLVPDGTALRAAVTQALHGLIVDEGGPGETLRITHVRNAISNTPDETDHVLSLPAADVLMAANQVAVPGVITWL
ncbi:baseplate J/gp47 family protein [Pseudomonas fragi]|uniref:baseplate J/gp47 family protein n=1 Tax=Pseudomonas fragi TaxID=296 RepID=UPI00147507D8|nr:baseplate J/gp47 family protein [Pseudomonas fragi]NNB08722.1 baseplate J/gp47 family protein [Pseudomonas fragi]